MRLRISSGAVMAYRLRESSAPAAVGAELHRSCSELLGFLETKKAPR